MPDLPPAEAPDPAADPDLDAMIERRRRRAAADRSAVLRTAILIAGLTVAAAGWLTLLYYWLVYDPMVVDLRTTQPVYHLGRVGDRLAGMIIGGVVALTGTLIAGFGLLWSAVRK